jgi:hypothetical protein
MRYLLLSIILMGCGPAQGVWRFDCLNVEVPEDIIESGHTIHYNAIESSAQLARKLFDQHFGDGEFCKRAETVTVKMMPHTWDCIGSSAGCQGEWVGLESRVKVISGYSLLHEFIHVQETYELKPGTMWHEDWVKNGNYRLADEFENTHPNWWN